MCHRSELGRVLIKICVYGNMFVFYDDFYIGGYIYGGERRHISSERAKMSLRNQVKPCRHLPVCEPHIGSRHIL